MPLGQQPEGCMRLCHAEVEHVSCRERMFGVFHRSLGCVFYELTAQRPTFNAFNIHGLVSKIKKNKLAPLPSSYSADWKDAIEL
jgi:hypothetical protein